MGSISFSGIVTNLSICIDYKPAYGEYGILRDGSIVKIESWSTTIEPQELHFKRVKRHPLFTGSFAKTNDFLGFSNSKRKLRKYRKYLKSVGIIK